VDELTNTSTPAVAERVQSRLQRFTFGFEAARLRLTLRLPLSQRVEAESGEGDDWTFLRRPMILGFIAVLSVCVGASLPSSPFKLEMTGTWFFGVPAANTTSTALLLPGMVAVYGGMILFVRVWFGLVQTLRHRPGVPIRKLAAMLALWIVPLLLVAPLFSRDVFSYAAQGEMMSHHINPYIYGPGTDGSGQFVGPVDHLWINTPAPYGPLFLMVDGLFATLSGHNALFTVLLLRLLSIVGVALIAYCIPKLARSYGRDPGRAFVLAVLNPLTLLALVGGVHNDAIMVGLLLAGITAARHKHPVWGIILCTLAAAIKIPAALGIVYIAWDWSGAEVGFHRRISPMVKAAGIALTVMTFLSVVSGLGWGWIANLTTPGTVRSWMAPATAVGLLISGLAHVVGFAGVSLGGVLTVTRLLGLLGAVAIGGYCLRHRERLGTLSALGITMLMFVLLGPVVQPWYLTWGIILLAPVLDGRIRYLALGLSMVAPFIGLTGGADLLNQLVNTNPAAMVVAIMALWGIVMLPLGAWTSSWRIDPSRISSTRATPPHGKTAALES
jgi:hypothetical protein